MRGFAGNIGTEYFPNVTDTTPFYETSDGGETWKAGQMGKVVNKIRLLKTKDGFVGYAIGVDLYKLDYRGN